MFFTIEATVGLNGNFYVNFYKFSQINMKECQLVSNFWLSKLIIRIIVV